MTVRRLLAVGILLSMGAMTPAWAQYGQETFGKNRIQYRQFNWQYLSGENFDVYYYDARKATAQEAIVYLESEFDRITDLIAYPPYFKTKVFIYNSLSDLRQSNVGLNRTVFTINGETEFVKPYVEVAFPGTVQEFKEELLFKISELMVNEMMFGGNLKDVFQSSILLNLPDWFVDGAALYVSKGWSSEMDDQIRQTIKTRGGKKITRLVGKEAAFAGQSVWNFIAEKYGKSSVGNILNYTRITRNEEKSVLITLGISFKQLMTEWYKYYSDMADNVNKSYVAPSDSTQFTHWQNKTTVFTTVKLSPDGRYLAYAENDRGRYVVKVRNLENGRDRTILSGGSKVIRQRVDYHLPVLSWADDHTLGVIGVKYGQYVFWLYDLSTRTKLPRELDRFSNVRSINFSANGRLAVLSADFEGRNDLFLVSSRRDRVRRLTNDVFDDLDPAFVPGTNRIVFSSNRASDSLHIGGKQPEIGQVADNFNLYLFDLDSTRNMLTRVTNTLSKDYAPLAQDISNVFYLSDQRGIVNLFRYNRSTGIYSQVTNFSSSISNYDISFATNTLAFVATKDRRQSIYVNYGFNLNRQVFTPATRRKELQQARVIRERRKQEENKSMSIKDLLNARMKQAQEEKKEEQPAQQQPAAPTDMERQAEKRDSTEQSFLNNRLKSTPPAATPQDSVKPQTPTPAAQTRPQTTAPRDTTMRSFLDKRMRQSQKPAADTVPARKDSTVTKTDRVNTDNYQFEEEKKPGQVATTPPANAPRKKEDVVNTDNYKFEDEAVKAQPGESFMTRYMKSREKSRITGPFPYESKFSADNLVTSLVIDPLRGVGILIETQMNDMLENYRFNGGLMTTIDLRNSDVYAEFQYLPAFIDFSARFDRKAIRWEPYANEESFKYSLNKLEVGASVPISDRLRFTVKPAVSIAQSVSLGLVNGPASTVDYAGTTYNYYGGGTSELVYDNSVSTGMNLMEGTRAKFSFMHNQGLNDSNNSFSRVSADIRHYQKLYREIVLAVRGFGGSFFGPSPKQYLLGGMNNWAFNKTRREGTTSEGEANPLGVKTENQDLLFTEFATNLRGFDYGTLFGNSVLLFNAELRVPLVKALTNAPINSNFFRNLQFTAFYDIGSSWSGKAPFSKQTSVSYSVIKNGAFEAQIKNYLNPWLYSYGLGVRTVLFGYYVKFDFAWPVENYEVQKPRGFLTLGFDF
jgi:Tol biopolymer transport system component